MAQAREEANGTDPLLSGEPGYNEYYYLTENSDVVHLINSGEYENGLDHYISVGKGEGRRAYAPGAIID